MPRSLLAGLLLVCQNAAPPPFLPTDASGQCMLPLLARLAWARTSHVFLPPHLACAGCSFQTQSWHVSSLLAGHLATVWELALMRVMALEEEQHAKQLGNTTSNERTSKRRPKKQSRAGSSKEDSDGPPQPNAALMLQEW